MTKITFENSNCIISYPDCFNCALTLDCGQAFRWQYDGEFWSGVAFGKEIKIKEENNKITLFDVSEEDFNNIWYDYFDLSRDYKELYEIYKSDENLSLAVDKYRGIRVLNQDIWETLCSFIISQNNNIPRIKGIIDRLCKSFGEKLESGAYTFPSAEVISKCTLENLSVLRAGFRAKYILDAAQKVIDKTVDLNALEFLPIEEARTSLQKIKGVGPKVAECVLLYSCKKTNAFPQDVWIKRVMAEYYPDGLPKEILPTCGIAQQYLFHSIRNRD